MTVRAGSHLQRARSDRRQTTKLGYHQQVMGMCITMARYEPLGKQGLYLLNPNQQPIYGDIRGLDGTRKLSHAYKARNRAHEAGDQLARHGARSCRQ